MICPTCIKERKNAKFCPTCGKPLLANPLYALREWHERRRKSATKRMAEASDGKLEKIARTYYAHAHAVAALDWAIPLLPDPQGQFLGPALPMMDVPNVLEPGLFAPAE